MVGDRPLKPGNVREVTERLTPRRLDESLDALCRNLGQSGRSRGLKGLVAKNVEWLPELA